jgi:signal transduction histidine kinase
VPNRQGREFNAAAANQANRGGAAEFSTRAIETGSNMTAGGKHEISLEEQVAILKEQLARAQKLTALGELVGTTTHEFNNVLMTIINYARMGLRHKDEPTRDKALTRILAAGERAAKITSVVLGVARNRSDSLEPTDLAKLIEDSLVLLEREMTKYRISVERQFESVPEAMANGNQIQQVLLNLLINARQAMPSGGRLVIKLAHDTADDMVDLVVRDTGCGIGPDKLRRIFDPYFSTKNGPDETGKGGTGLGLSSCRNIIEAHRGRIRVESTVGKGTAFTIKIPAVKKPVAAPASGAVGTVSVGSKVV